MRHPLDAVIPPLQRGKALLVLLGLTVTMGGIIEALSEGLKTDKAGQGIASLQLAGEPLVTDSILKSWALKVPTAGRVVELDYTFLLLYSTTLALGCVWASKLWDTPGLSGLGTWLAWGQWAAGVFNGIQDFALLRILDTAGTGLPSILGPTGTPPEAWTTETARFCALAKFGLIEAGALYIAASALFYGLGPRLRLAAAADK